MANICTCPSGTAIESLDAVTCKRGFGQIQKLIFQRRKNGDALNTFGADNAITAKASWTATMTADDSTKTVMTPYVNSPEITAGDARTVGGGNDSINGIEEIIGANPTEWSFTLTNMPQDVVAALKKLRCEDLVVFPVNQYGEIGAIKVSANVYAGIPISSLFVGDMTLGGFEANDSNALTFKTAPDWSDDFVATVPADFNALTDLN